MINHRIIAVGRDYFAINKNISPDIPISQFFFLFHWSITELISHSHSHTHTFHTAGHKNWPIFLFKYHRTLQSGSDICSGHKSLVEVTLTGGWCQEQNYTEISPEICTQFCFSTVFEKTLLAADDFHFINSFCSK